MSALSCLLLLVALVSLVDVEGKPQNKIDGHKIVMRNIDMVRDLRRKIISDVQDRRKKSSDTLVCNSCHGTQYTCEYEEKECAAGQLCGSIWDNDNNFNFNGCMEPQLCDLIEKTGVTSVACCDTDLCNWQI
ncbi:uncharacterized protein LOC121375546 [Gigantopelta aegis]|uniref:uncharacterized protein LOC121375546 n=1 Tax=Gigantopelta aegis TaxID=1735272 RepID=UPI001B88C214|nr:uncharacterized protein LOC121375546 [Gigantopelta aegis]